MTADRGGRLHHALAELVEEPRETLVNRWQRAYGRAPTSGTRRELLVASAAWHLQAKRFGGLSREARRRLNREMQRIVEADDGAHAGAEARARESDEGFGAPAGATPQRRSVPQPAERRSMQPGARLLRDWNGRTHAVDVVAGGYLYDGRTHRSLSAIAKTITGAHWSGPRFFGL